MCDWYWVPAFLVSLTLMVVARYRKGAVQWFNMIRGRDWGTTTNPMPMIYVAEEAPRYRLRSDGSLRDISPTMLNILSLGLPREMTGGDLRVPLSK